MEFKSHPRSIIARPKAKLSPADKELNRYDEYMDHVRGLAPQTRSMALRIVGRLLTSQFGDGPVKISAIKPDHVRCFFAEQAKLYSKPVNAGTVVASLRGYFRYRASRCGAWADWCTVLPRQLATAIAPQIPDGRRGGTTCGRARATRSLHAARRRHCRCALDLGLRRGEVARIGLDDINWRDGTITLRHTKSRRDDVMPLPIATGKAIAAYLQHERPKTDSRAVFVRHNAPRGLPVGPDLVRKAIRQAYARAGLPYTRSHLLRHTMANRLLTGGSSLKEVADVLRHRSLNTTMIDAKLDSRKLIEVALPWPGSESRARSRCQLELRSIQPSGDVSGSPVVPRGTRCVASQDMFTASVIADR